VLGFVSALACCNVLIGVNDFSTPSCEECQRRECSAAFSACRADQACADLNLCLLHCTTAECQMRCNAPPGEAGQPGPLPPGTGSSAVLMACAQTKCEVCSPPMGDGAVPGPPPPLDPGPPVDASRE
jgi:hypothetical protein